MSVWVHKLNKQTNEVDSQLVSAKRLQGHLKAGWSTSNPGAGTKAQKSEQQDLSSLTVPKLKELAEKAGVDDFQYLKKQELIAALNSKQGE